MERTHVEEQFGIRFGSQENAAGDVEGFGDNFGLQGGSEAARS